MPQNTQTIVSLIEKFGHQLSHKCDCEENGINPLTMAQVKLLTLVWHHKKIAMVDIAKQLKITPASATSLVDRMVKHKWLERVSDDKDRRKIYIQMAEDKNNEFEKFYQKRVAQCKEYLAVLNKDQQQQLITILEILVSQNK